MEVSFSNNFYLGVFADVWCGQEAKDSDFKLRITVAERI